MTNHAFIYAMDHTVVIAAIVALIGALVAFVYLPARPVRAGGRGLRRPLDRRSPQTAQDLPGGVKQRPDSTRPAISGVIMRMLAEAGFSSLSFHGVATRSGVSTATLERYWTSKVDLVIEALRAAFEEHPVPDTGSLALDCREYLGDVGVALSTPEIRTVIAGLIDDAARNPDLGAVLRDRLIAPRHRDLAAMVQRGIDRGEVRHEVDPDVLVDVLIAPRLPPRARDRRTGERPRDERDRRPDSQRCIEHGRARLDVPGQDVGDWSADLERRPPKLW